MHLEGMVWCNKHATDGHIPAYAMQRVTDQDDPEAAAKQLVSVGLWEATEDGWFIVVFADDQPSAADQERTKAYDRQRQRRHRLHVTGDHSECDARYCREASRVTHGVSDGVSHGSPSRPDPTRPEGRGGRGEDEQVGSASSGGSASLAASSALPPQTDHDREPWHGDGPPPGITPTVEAYDGNSGKRFR
jgi:hypothetical protein